VRAKFNGDLMTTGRAAAFCLCLLGALALVAGGCSFVFNPPAREDQDLYYLDLAQMRGAADRIVTARLTDRNLEKIFDPESGALLEELEYHSFEVLEKFKGSADPGEKLHVAFPSVLTFNAGETLAVGDVYLLFLNGRARDRQYPVDYGGTVWRLNGEPSLAEFDGERATFWRRSDFTEPQHSGTLVPEIITRAELRNPDE